MGANKQDRMRMRLLFGEQLAKEVLSQAILEGRFDDMAKVDFHGNDLIDRIYRLADLFIDCQQEVVDEYKLNEPPPATAPTNPVIQVPPGMRGNG